MIVGLLLLFCCCLSIFRVASLSFVAVSQSLVSYVLCCVTCVQERDRCSCLTATSGYLKTQLDITNNATVNTKDGNIFLRDM